MMFPRCLHLFTSAIKPAQQCPDSALPSGTLGKLTNLPAHPKEPITNHHQPWHPGSTTILFYFWLVGNSPYTCIKYVGTIPVLIHETGIYRCHSHLPRQAEKGGIGVNILHPPAG